MISTNLHQLNHKPTRHQVGNRSSLLDLYLSNVPQRVSNMENIMNTTSEHEGVRCILLLKSSIRQGKSFLKRDFRNCTYNLMQPLVDSNFKLQSLFSDRNPEIIADKLGEGLKEITDLLVVKQQIQQRSRGSHYWCSKLKKEREKVKSLN